MTVKIRKELFLDDREIEAMEGLQFSFHEPQPYSGNPIIIPELPWEEKCISPAAVIYDPLVKKFRMWYQVYYSSNDSFSSGTNLETALADKGYRYGVGYAESEDGIHFTKPLLGRVQHGNYDTNLAIKGYNSPAPATCILDLQEPNPHKRYRLWVWDSADHPGKHSIIGMSLYVSKDGLDWKGYEWHNEWCNDPQPYCYVKMVGEYRYPYNIGPNECNGIYQDDVTGKFVNYCRASNGSVRCIGRMESADGIHWNQPVLVATPDLQDPLFYQFYLAYPYRSGEFVILYVTTYDPCNGYKCEVELFASRDGFSFARVGNRQKWIKTGLSGSWNAGMISARAPVNYNDKLWIYAGGTVETHDAPATQGSMGLYHLRPDGYVSLDAGPQQGMFATRRFVWSHDQLNINACTKQGEIRVEVIPAERGLRLPVKKGKLRMADCYPDALSGYTAQDCLPFAGDSTSGKIVFRNASLSSLKGRYVQLRFSMRNAELYSWELI